MLILKRKPGEDILIGDVIRVRLVKIGESRIWLGIEAPPGTPILRGELLEQSPKDHDASSSSSDPTSQRDA